MLVILAHPTVSSDPSEGAFDDPGETHNLERPLTAFNDSKLVALGFDEPCELAALVTGIRDDRFDRRKDWPRPPSKRAVARRSDMLAASTRLAIGMPKVSTRICRFLPLIRLWASKPRMPLFR